MGNSKYFHLRTGIAVAAVVACVSSLSAQVYIDTPETVPGTQTSPWNIGNTLTVGHTGNGSLIISGGTVSNTVGFIGHDAGATGSVEVNGAGSIWTNSTNLFIGYNGNGSLKVSDGGVVSSHSGNIGYAAGSTGAVEVTGSGSRWDVTHAIYVGQNGGSGSFIIADGGVVTTGYQGYISSSGIVEVKGNNTQWTISSSLQVNGSLTISGGGKVSNTSATIAMTQNSSSTSGVLVTGAGSEWINSGYLDIGLYAIGTPNAWLTISDGALVTSVGAAVAKGAGSTATVVVTGNGSQWKNNSFTLLVGEGGGTGSVVISDGGLVSTRDVTIGSEAGSSGSLEVTGTGSQLLVNVNATVGRKSTGLLKISGGGLVSVGGPGVIGVSNTAQGHVEVSGAGSQLLFGDYLMLGSDGTGSLLISDGGLVSNRNGYIGYNSGSEGSVVVTGAGSHWLNSDTSLLVAYKGTGSLTVSDGGLVTNNGLASVASNAGSEGSAEVTGPGSQWINASGLTVGGSGNATLRIADGGVVSNTSGIIANSSGSQGMVIVTGSGSQWNNSGYLGVGSSGTGSLHISDGGLVTNASHAYIGYSGNSVGSVVVTGDNSRWINSGYLEMGHASGSSAELIISDGGFVSNTSADIAIESRSNAKVVVTGNGSSWINTGDLAVGRRGKGSLTIADNALVRSDGRVLVASNIETTGVINIGAAATDPASAPGVLDASVLVFGSGNGTIVFNHTAFEGTSYNFAPSMSGRGRVNVLSGVTTLTGTNSYTGVTTVAGGTLKAGGVSAFSPSSIFAVQSAGTLDLNGTNQTISMLQNAGTVIVAGGSVGKTLTITNSLTGDNGTFVLNTILNNDASLTDQIVLDDSSADGPSKLLIRNQGGTGAQTDVGIMVVSAINGATTSEDSFTLDPRSPGYRSTTQSLTAGAYDYNLVRGGSGRQSDSFYLVSFNTPIIVEPDVGPEEPGVVPQEPDIEPRKPTYRPEAGIYLANQQVAQSMFITTLRDRQGYAQTENGAEPNTYAGWGRVTGRLSNGKAGQGTLNTQSEIWTAQLGVDLLYLEGQAGTFHGGVMGGIGRADTKASSRIRSFYQADGRVDGYSVGVYGTWYESEKDGLGFYADGWTQYGWYDNEVKGIGLQKEKYKSETFTASLEIGHSFELNRSENWRVMFEPQVQVIYVNYNADTYVEQGGTVVRLKNDDGFMTRIGGRFYGIYTYADGRTLRPYMEANWWYRQKSGGVLMNADYVKGGASRNIAEIKLGVQGEFAKNWSVGGHIAGQIGDRNHNAISAQFGTKYTW
ncbi:autotransporter outer membrane beta-barrel domain-containing protein [Microvirga sp. W0021]|uniref:Autotransporter outer membrane beta-barrel domain-containing protein n=1 Tax=Hohaiivirga grylli TaxID=3133970 RepID=A0ABV0BND4_9HYPH